MLKSKNVFAGVGLVGCCSEWANNSATTDNTNSCMQLSQGQFFFLLSVLIMLVVCVCEDVWWYLVFFSGNRLGSEHSNAQGA